MLQRFLSVVLIGAAFGWTLTTAVPAGAAEGDCPSGAWPSYTAGRPTSVKVGMTGMALWRDGSGWHLRVSEAGRDRAVFKGTITTDGRLAYVGRHLEGGDATISRSDDRIGFRFTNYGGVDGLDFRAACGTELTIAGSMDGRRLPPTRVVIGGANTHPGSVPFTVSRAA